MPGPGDRPEATFVAVAGDEVVGYAKFALTEAQPTRRLTTSPASSGRGAARDRQRSSGADRLGEGERLRATLTNNEERNEPIRRLNERLGYRPVPGRSLMRGRSPADTPHRRPIGAWL